MSASEKRAYVLADNKIALDEGWDEELLASELKELMEADIDFDVGVIGFTIAEVDQLIEGLAPEEAGDPADDALSAGDSAPPRCQRPAMSGGWGRIASFVAMLWKPRLSRHSWTASGPTWSSPIRRTMSRSMAT
jgi:hypothetical protein